MNNLFFDKIANISNNQKKITDNPSEKSDELANDGQSFGIVRKTIKNKFDERFIRMWQLYLCSCAAVFNNGICDLHQILFTKGINNSIPITRNYMYED